MDRGRRTMDGGLALGPIYRRGCGVPPEPSIEVHGDIGLNHFKANGPIVFQGMQ